MASVGIDSTAACLMLQEQGYEVVGVTMRVFDLASQLNPEGIQSNNMVKLSKSATVIFNNCTLPGDASKLYQIAEGDYTCTVLGVPTTN